MSTGTPVAEDVVNSLPPLCEDGEGGVMEPGSGPKPVLQRALFCLSPFFL